MKAVAKLSFFLVLICFAATAFARAGSGGGGGGGGGYGGGGYYGSGGSGGGGGTFYIVMAVMLIIYGYYYYRRIDNRQKAKEIMASSKDEHWRNEYLCEHTRKMFFAIQDAWMQRSLEAVSNQVTYYFYVKHNPILQEMIDNDEQNILENIDIKTIEIIGCHDYLDDDLDVFTAQITGKLLDYTINVTSGKVVKNTWKVEEKFCDLFIFTRSEGEWVLNDIINNPDVDTLNGIASSVETE
jgi:hypothetical protein